jgi:hypothetical protein
MLALPLKSSMARQSSTNGHLHETVVFYATKKRWPATRVISLAQSKRWEASGFRSREHTVIVISVDVAHL